MGTPGSTVLVLTARFDPTADMVIEHLNRRAIPVFRVDPGELPDRLSVSAELDRAGFATTLRLPERSMELSEVACAWYRRPTAFVFDGLTEHERRWATAEARAGLGGLIGLVPRWLNHPAAIGAAEYKPRQLALAAGVGLAVPRTLITNDPARAAAFAAKAGQIIYKPLASSLLTDTDGEAKIIYTTPVDAAAAGSAGVASTVHLFQQRIAKDHELRITFIDGDCHTARIDTNSVAAGTDWRADRDHVTYTPAMLPNDVAARLDALMAALGLRYGAIDMIVDPAGTHWLLEVNPNGQFGFIEHTTGLPLSAAIAAALTTPPSTGSRRAHQYRRRSRCPRRHGRRAEA